MFANPNPSFPMGTSTTILKSYSLLKKFKTDSTAFLCRENATQRLMVVKAFGSDRQEAFEKEAQMQYALRATGIFPDIFFAVSDDNFSFIGREFIASKTLAEAMPELNTNMRTSVMRELKAIVQRLHIEHKFSHRDLSPANILVINNSIQGPKHFRIRLLDLEHAVWVHSEKYEDYNAYRGTPGFSAGQNLAGIDKDLEAIKRIAKWMGVETPLTSQNWNWRSLSFVNKAFNLQKHTGKEE